MNTDASLLSFSLMSLLFFLDINQASSQTCKNSCGGIPIHYPFGTGLGCGSPQFQSFVTCDSNQQNLIFRTHTGSYPVQSIDYTNQILYIQDPSMSTCSCSNPSNGFSLDWNAPFTFADGNIFALLDCSTSASPLYTSSSATGANSSNVPLCDTANTPICSLLYSCPPVSELNVPISTCCIYTPIDLGPSFEMDLKKLQCNSYAGIYSFNGQEANPSTWKYGIALKYRFSIDNGYPSACANCEQSHGVCGFTGQNNAFTCNCPNGRNTTMDCYFAQSWSRAYRDITSLWIGFWLIPSWFVVFLMFF